jgi:hypothetical protein
LAYEKGFEKKALEQQAAILGVLQKIQAAFENGGDDGSSGGAASAAIISPLNLLNQTVSQVVVKEMQEQTSVLRDIRSAIKDAANKPSASNDSGRNETRSAREKISDVAMKVGDTVKNIALLAGAIIVFAGALKLVSVMLKPADMLVIVPFMLVMSLAFVAFSKIVEASKGLTAKEALATGILMVTLATSIVAVAGIFMAFSAMGPLSFPDPLWVLGAGLAIFIFTLPVMMIMKAMTSGGVLGGQKVAGGQLNPKVALTVGLLMVATAVAIAGVALVFSKMLVPVTPADAPNIIWALTAGLGIAIFGLTTAMFIKNIKQSGGYGDMLRIPIIIAGAIIATAVGMVGAAYVMQGFPQVTPDDAPNIIWALTAGLSLAIFGIGFALLAKYVKDPEAALVGGLAMIVVAGVIFTTAWIFNYLPDNLRYPNMDFVKGAGIAVAAFGAAYALMTKFIGEMEVSSILKGALAMVITAALIVGVAYIFQMLPEDLRFPSEEFSIGAGVAVAVFGAAIAGVGFLVEAVTPAGFAFGALGVLIAALVIVGVAWIFTLLPESLFAQGGLIYKATDALYYFGSAMIKLFEQFGNAIVDVALKFLNGVGDFLVKVDKVDLLSIAGGIAAVAGAMAVLTGALMGSSVGSSLGNLFSSVVDFGASLLGGDDNSSPKVFLEYLITNAALIATLGPSIDLVGKGLTATMNSAVGATTGITNFVEAILGPRRGSGVFPGVKQVGVTMMDEIVLGFNSMTVQLDKLLTFKKPLDQIADSMQDFADATKDFANAINSIQVENLSKLQESIQSIKDNVTDEMIQRYKTLADTNTQMAETSGGVAGAITDVVSKVGDKIAGTDSDGNLAKNIAMELVKVLNTQGSIKVTQNGTAIFQFDKNSTQVLAKLTTQ